MEQNNTKQNLENNSSYLNSIAKQKPPKKKDIFLPISIVIAALIIAFALIYAIGLKTVKIAQFQESKKASTTNVEKGGSVSQNESQLFLEKEVLPDSLVLPFKWGSLGKQMIEAGVIDPISFEKLYESRGGLDEETKKLLSGTDNGNLVITLKNSGIILNLLWAFGFGNKNPILENGPMTDPKYGGDPSRFASTGGWTLAKGNQMLHYSAHKFINLGEEEQKKVERVSKNIYRPCCNNSTYFPDCNHGMAMLGLLELLAANGASEDEMYKSALQVNAYWFPDTYLTIAQYLKSKGINFKDANPKEILGFNYSSASGFQRIVQEITPVQYQGGGSCGV